VEKELHHLIEELEKAINASLSDSDRFAEIMAEMEQAGYDVYVVLEASIGLRKNGETEVDASATEVRVSPQPKFDSSRSTEMSADDLDFLKALKISVA
jgi:hypothetical protein